MRRSQMFKKKREIEIHNKPYQERRFFVVEQCAITEKKIFQTNIAKPKSNFAVNANMWRGLKKKIQKVNKKNLPKTTRDISGGVALEFV